MIDLKMFLGTHLDSHNSKENFIKEELAMAAKGVFEQMQKNYTQLSSEDVR